MQKRNQRIGVSAKRSFQLRNHNDSPGAGAFLICPSRHLTHNTVNTLNSSRIVENKYELTLQHYTFKNTQKGKCRLRRDSNPGFRGGGKRQHGLSYQKVF